MKADFTEETKRAQRIKLSDRIDKKGPVNLVGRNGTDFIYYDHLPYILRSGKDGIGREFG